MVESKNDFISLLFRAFIYCQIVLLHARSQMQLEEIGMPGMLISVYLTNQPHLTIVVHMCSS